MKLNNNPAPLRESHPIRPLKTPAAQLAHARNWHRRKKGKPESLEELPLHARTDFNRPRRGSGNLPYQVSLPPKVWAWLDERAEEAKQTRGEFILDALKDYENFPELP